MVFWAAAGDVGHVNPGSDGRKAGEGVKVLQEEKEETFDKFRKREIFHRKIFQLLVELIDLHLTIYFSVAESGNSRPLCSFRGGSLI
jgi:hypothetical protein